MISLFSRGKTKFVSLSVKLSAGVITLSVALFSIVFFWFYHSATGVAMERVKEDLENTLKVTLNGIDGDEFEALYQEGVARADGYTDDARYWKQAEWFLEVNQIEPRARIYTYTFGNPALTGEAQFVSTLGALWDNPDEWPKFREPFLPSNPPESEPMWLGFKGLTTDMEPYQDEFGEWVSAYIPIKNSAGNVVGALGMDFEASYIRMVQQSVMDVVLPVFLITIASVLLLMMAYSQIIMRPIMTLTRIAENIGEGNYAQDFTPITRTRMPDEVTTLASVFELMVIKIQQREQVLKRQVEELRIEIDETRRHIQVKEIVDTDFFHDLVDKASKIRQRRSDQLGGQEIRASEK